MSNNAYAYTNHIEVEPKHSGLIIKHKDTPVKCQAVRHAPTGRGGLSFTSHALFRTIEDIAAWPGPSATCSTDAPVSALTVMVAELEGFGMCSYWRFKAWVNYHRDMLKNVRFLFSQGAILRSQIVSASVNGRIDEKPC